MFKPRFQFKIKALLIAIALLAGSMSFVRPLTRGDAPIIDLFGPVQIGKDGSVAVHGGSVRIRRGNEQTEIRGSRIVVRRDGTAEVDGHGTIVQSTR
jgi:hypothetical protein